MSRDTSFYYSFLVLPPSQRRTLFERMSDVARTGQIVEALDDAAKRSAMPPDQQLRFRSALDQMSGQRPRRDPLPKPPDE